VIIKRALNVKVLFSDILLDCDINCWVRASSTTRVTWVQWCPAHPCKKIPLLSQPALCLCSLCTLAYTWVQTMLNLFVVCPVGWWQAANFQDKLAKYKEKCISNPNCEELTSKTYSLADPWAHHEIKCWLRPCYELGCELRALNLSVFTEPYMSGWVSVVASKSSRKFHP